MLLPIKAFGIMLSLFVSCNSNSKLCLSIYSIFTLIFIAGKQAINPENEARGALKAGYEYHSLSQLQVVGFRYQDDTTFNANQKELFENNYQMRKSMNVITDEEVKDLITHHINKIYSDVQVYYY